LKKPTPTAPKSTPTPQKTKAPRARLLLVEDHEPTRTALSRLLTKRNFTVKAASCVEEAWALAEANTFDAIVSDIGLPDGDGFLLMREMQERHGLKGIALTGYGMEDDIKLAKEAGFSVHLTKPVKASVLDAAFISLGF
jgi:CheY-like chemotaxis protein